MGPGDFAPGFGQRGQGLNASDLAHRHHQLSALRQLLDEGPGNCTRGSRHQNDIERSLFGPSLIPIPNPNLDVVVSQFLESPSGTLSQERDNLNRLNLTH